MALMNADEERRDEEEKELHPQIAQMPQIKSQGYGRGRLWRRRRGVR
jgi:hypothetical protein